MIDFSLLKNCKTILGTLVDSDFKQKRRIVTDTRKFSKNEAFCAIPGQKVNPLTLLDPLLSNGLNFIFYQSSSENDQIVLQFRDKYKDARFLAVNDSVVFLQELTHLFVKEWRNQGSNRHIFAISGSNGKTTHKEMLAFILKKVLPGKIVATEKNNNNHLGVPLTLLDINDQTELVILELGSNHPGEIPFLCQIAEPDAGLTTNIGATHLEFFGTEKEVFIEEGFLYYSIKQTTNGKGFYLINADDSYLKNFPKTEGSVSFGIDNGEAQISFEENGARISYKDQIYSYKNFNLTGRHNFSNMATCLFIACHYYPALQNDFECAAAEFRPTPNRSEWKQILGKDIFADAYNANPSSMKVALLGFKDWVLARGLALSDALIILGDMNELGENAPSFHLELGQFLRAEGFSNVCFIGRFASSYQQGFSPLKSQSVANAQEYKAQFKNDLHLVKVVFLKGSRSLQLESLLDIT